VDSIRPDDAAAERERLTFVDIRKNPDDRQIPRSLRYDGEELAVADDFPFARDEQIVVYCGRGNSSRRVVAALRERGYVNARGLEGGYAAWRDGGLPTEPRTGNTR
jgi:rhodanese-related sulfurtransferase